MQQWRYASLFYATDEDGYSHILHHFYDPNHEDIFVPSRPNETPSDTMRRCAYDFGQNGWELIALRIDQNYGEEWVFKQPSF